MATIHDVARVASVAPSTVSLVANGKPYVKPTTRKRVQAAMKRLGYRGRASRSASTQDGDIATLNVLVAYTPYSVHDGQMAKSVREAVNGVRQVLTARRAQVSVFAGAERVEDDPMFQHCLEAGEFDGIVLVSPRPGEGYLEAVLKAGVPVTTINRPPEHAQYSSVCVDYYGAGRRAARHLVKLGHRRLALTGKRTRWISRETHAGFTDALAEHDMEPALVIHTDDDHPNAEDARRMAAELTEANVTALFTGDRWGLLVAEELHRRGIDIPGDLSLLGLDNLGVHTPAGRRFTSIGFPPRRMGRMAAQLMLRRLRRPRLFQHASLSMPTAIYRGQTTAPLARPGAAAAGE